jgi:hypothetical protein
VTQRHRRSWGKPIPIEPSGEKVQDHCVEAALAHVAVRLAVIVTVGIADGCHRPYQLIRLDKELSPGYFNF